MQKKENSGKDELTKMFNMYKDIYRASNSQNKWGISLRELKKKYGLRKRDLPVLFDIVNKYDLFDGCSEYQIYRFKSDSGKLDDSQDFSEIDTDLYEFIYDKDSIDEECFIRITDRIMMLQEKISLSDIDATNVSFVEKIGGRVSELWKDVSNARLNPEYIVNRQELNLAEHTADNKRELVKAIVRGSQVELTYNYGGRTKTQKAYPAGLYYDSFLEDYLLVYTLDGKTYEQMELSGIHSVRKTDCEEYLALDFDIDQYIQKEQTEKMVLKVYHEAKVVEKWRAMLEKNQLQVKEGEEYDIFEFMVINPWNYLRMINGSGRSVVVLEPTNVRDDILQMAKQALSYYI